VTVLVVEDEAMVRAKLAEELEDAGYLAVEASDGAEAVEMSTLSQMSKSSSAMSECRVQSME
jgi:CheY-like chemotaxis protein